MVRKVMLVALMTGNDRENNEEKKDDVVAQTNARVLNLAKVPPR